MYSYPVRDDPFLKMVLPPDARIVAVVRQLLESVDLATTSPRALREQAEEELGLPAQALNARKALIKAEIAAFVARQEEEDDEDADADTDVLDDTPMSPISTTATALLSDAVSARSSPDIANNPDITANTSNSLSPATGPPSSSATKPSPFGRKPAVAPGEPLPLVLSQKRKCQGLLLQLSSEIDLGGDTGAIGRVECKDKRVLSIDIKGDQFLGTLMPSATLMVVQTTPAEAKIEETFDAFVECEHQGNIFESLKGKIKAKGKIDDELFTRHQEDVNARGAHNSDDVASEAIKRAYKKSRIGGEKKPVAKAKGKKKG